MKLGAMSLSDIRRDAITGIPVTAVRRVADAIEYAVLSDRLGLGAFDLGEHHTLGFAVSSPASA